MAWFPGLIILVFVVVCTVAPFLFLSGDDEHASAMSEAFGNMAMAGQVLMYGLARLCSFVFIPNLQLALLAKHGFGGAAIVVSLGEATGCVAHFYLVR
jgi:hypothetical protein